MGLHGVWIVRGVTYLLKDLFRPRWTVSKNLVLGLYCVRYFGIAKKTENPGYAELWQIYSYLFVGADLWRLAYRAIVAYGIALWRHEIW